MAAEPRRGPRARGWMLPLAGALVLPAAVAAHEVRPAYLELTEVSAGAFEVLWKQPAAADGEPGRIRRLPLRPAFPAHCRETDRRVPEVTASALIERWTIDCGAGGLTDAPIEIAGLPRTLTDVLLRVRFRGGASVDHLLRPEAPRVALAPETGRAAVPAYLRLGVEHLLFGFDHVLFVVGLMFLVRRPRQLVAVVTSFTAAHSVTLALSTLGAVTLPQRPVEAVIALSILYLAVELAGADGDPARAGGRRGPLASPWTIAFGFGLLHGFGFAGALADVGLPAEARAMALLLFNAGVEIGQLAVVGVLLAGLYGLRAARVPLPPAVARAPIYVMGAVSAWWFLERMLSIVS